jgi:hypothetical protein
MQAADERSKIFITAEIPKALEKAARIQAAVEGVSRSEIVRRGLELYLEKVKSND